MIFLNNQISVITIEQILIALLFSFGVYKNLGTSITVIYKFFGLLSYVLQTQ